MNHEQLMKNTIFNTLDKIENRLGKMAHEIPELSDKLKLWQDDQLNDSSFKETLNKFIDKLNEGK